MDILKVVCVLNVFFYFKVNSILSQCRMWTKVAKESCYTPRWGFEFYWILFQNPLFCAKMMSVTFWNMQHFAVGNYSLPCMSSFTITITIFTFHLSGCYLFWKWNPLWCHTGHWRFSQVRKVLDLNFDTLPFSFTPSKRVALLPKHLFREEAANKGLKVQWSP